MKLKNLINLKALKEQPTTSTPEPIITKVKLKMSNIEDEVTIKHLPDSNLKDITISWGNESHTVDFDDVGEVQDHGNEGKDLEAIAESDDGRWQFILDVYAEATYPMTGDFADWDWDELIIQPHPDLDNWDDDIEEGTCGYSIDGEGGDEPAGPHLLKKSNLQERFQQLAGLKPLYEQGFDDRFNKAMTGAGFSDEEKENVFGQDILPDFDENDVKNIEDEAKVAENYEKTEYIVEILLPVTVPHFLLGLGAQDENGREEIAQKIADFYRKKIEHPKAYTGAVEKRNPAR